MNQFTKILSRTAGCAMMLLAAQACVADRAGSCPRQAAAPQLSLRLAVRDLPAMRAAEPGEQARNENKVESIQLLFYRAGTLYWAVAPQFDGEGNCSIPIPEDRQGGFDGNTRYDIYAVGNMPLSAPAQQADLERVVVTEPVSAGTNARFVMQGKTDRQIDLATEQGRQLGELGLHRVACKLRITTQTAVPGYLQEGPMQIKLVNAMDRGYLIAQQLPGEVRPIAGDYRDTESGAPQIYYSYHTAWSAGSGQAPHYLITVPLRQAGSSRTREYHYRVDLTPQDNRLVPNTLYDLQLQINKLGSLTPEDPVTLSGALSVLPWSQKDDLYDLPAANYLEVSEQTIYMYSVDRYSIAYQTSQEPVGITINEVSYSYVDADGREQTIPIDPASSQYPRIAADPASRTIAIETELPVNNVPKKILFTVSNGIAGMDKQVTAYQMPSSFITHTIGQKSSLKPDGTLAPGLNNRAIYCVTVMNTTEGMILGFPPTEQTNFYDRRGNIRHTDQTTRRDAETARMVSPSFELASQLGATTPYPYWTRRNGRTQYDQQTALCNCATYTETRIVGGTEVVLDDWRLPTEAEIEMIDRLQHDPQSAVNSIMTGDYYWDANNNDGAKRMQAGGGDGSQTQAYTRCVRDVKENTIQVPYRANRP